MARDLNLLHPEAKKKAEQLIQKCKEKGIEIIITQTLRTKAEQDELYAQGRTKPGKIVTNVKYPNSMHCWGVAFDIAVKVNGKVTWDTAWYKKVGPIGESIGLEWGGRWDKFPDYPHYQLLGYTLSNLKNKYGTPEKFIASWKKGEDDDVEPTKVLYKGKTFKGFIKDGKTYAEVRKLVEAFGKKVTWDNVKKVVEVKD